MKPLYKWILAIGIYFILMFVVYQTNFYHFKYYVDVWKDEVTNHTPFFQKPNVINKLQDFLSSTEQVIKEKILYPLLYPDLINSIKKNPTLPGKKLNLLGGSPFDGLSLETVNNIGYTFKLGQIDYENSPNISDDLKNTITNILLDAGFPKNLLNNMAIVIVNTLAAPDVEALFNPIFLKGGGVFTTINNGIAYIFINKTIIGNSTQLKDVLTHELGHRIDTQLTEQEWVEYYKLRGIPKNTPLNGEAWNLSPREDFADVYTNIFTGSQIKTSYYGFLEPVMDPILEILGACGELLMEKSNQLIQNGMMESLKMAGQNSEIQSCRKNIMLHPEKYTNEWRYGVPYKSVLTDATKNFVQKIINRLQ